MAMILAKTSCRAFVQYPDRVGITRGDFLNFYIEIGKSGSQIFEIMPHAGRADCGVGRIPNVVDMFAVIGKEIVSEVDGAFG